MNIRKNEQYITFPVDDVEPAREPLPECKIYDYMAGTIDSVDHGPYSYPEEEAAPLEACYSYTDNVVRAPGHPLVGAVHLAFSEHRPLILTPDAIWITIAQGLANHVHNHAEHLRDRLVSHEGTKDITIEVEGFVDGAPENPWQLMFPMFAEEIEARAPKSFQWLEADFSTSGPLELLVSRLVMMDVFQPFYNYRSVCVCGIPEITLEGTPADWQRLRAKVEYLHDYDCAWWLEYLVPVCDQFVRARSGDIDLDHWRRIYKLRDAYGEELMNGWIAHLFPYVRNYVTGRFTIPNPILGVTDEDWEDASYDLGPGLSADSLPSGLSFVPFQYRDRLVSKRMEFVGGVAGVHQEGLALKPKPGWAVREVRTALQFIDELMLYGSPRPPKPAGAVSEALHGTVSFLLGDVPAELNALYHKCDGIRFPQWQFEFLPVQDLEPLATVEHRTDGGVDYSDMRGIAFGKMQDGAWIAVDDYGFEVVLERTPEDRVFIARSVGEFLRLLMEDTTSAYFLKPEFVPLEQEREEWAG